MVVLRSATRRLGCRYAFLRILPTPLIDARTSHHSHISSVRRSESNASVRVDRTPFRSHRQAIPHVLFHVKHDRARYPIGA